MTTIKQYIANLQRTPVLSNAELSSLLSGLDDDYTVVNTDTASTIDDNEYPINVYNIKLKGDKRSQYELTGIYDVLKNQLHAVNKLNKQNIDFESFELILMNMIPYIFERINTVNGIFKFITYLDDSQDFTVKQVNTLTSKVYDFKSTSFQYWMSFLDEYHKRRVS
jgi:hypothetical protein